MKNSLKAFMFSLVLVSQPAHASLWTRFCASMFRSSTNQFEHMDSSDLIALYLLEAHDAIREGKPSETLAVIGNQIRKNYGDKPLPVLYRGILTQYKVLEVGWATEAIDLASLRSSLEGNRSESDR